MSMKYAVLGLLAESSRSGYDIKRRFEGALGNVWSLSYGQLYPTLRRLTDQGWVTKRSEPGKKAADRNIYSITEKGRKRLDDWLLKPPRSGYRIKDELTLRFLFFNRLPPEKVLDYLALQREKTELQKESFRRTLASQRGELASFLQSVIRRGILHLDAEMRWLSEVMSDLRSRKA